MPQSPISDNPLVAFRILTNGTAIKAAYQVQSVGVSQRVNCVGSAHRLLSPAMPPAARLTDLHTCPPLTPDLPPVPHVGGPILRPGAPTVLIEGPTRRPRGRPGPVRRATRQHCAGLSHGAPAAHMGHATAHGGSIVLGCFTVLIGS